MAKKSNQKRYLSRASQHTSDPSEQTPETQRMSPVATQRDNKSSGLTRSKELSPEVRSAHNIALLELLDPRPRSLTDRFQHYSTEQNETGRGFCIQQERELVTNLAFLAGVSDFPDHVMGICVEELPSIGGCQVMVAINKRLPSDGNEILTKVQRGFQQIFGRLIKLSDGKL